jgi:hypothetical protein
MDTMDLIKRLGILAAKYHAVQDELGNRYHFHQLRDVRINVFRHCALVVDSTYVIILVRLYHLFDEGWWNSMFDRNLISRHMTNRQRDTFLFGFDTFVDSSYITMLFVSVESAFRSFYSSVFSKDPPFKFYKVYGDLLHKFNLDEYKDLLRLTSLIRNSYHNNGIHTLDDEPVCWRNLTFHFKKGQKIVLGDVWNIFILITEDILEMLNKLVKSGTILQKQLILDTSYNNLL